MADPQPHGDGLAPLMAELREMKRQIRELQKPTGTQYANSVGNMVQPAVWGGSVKAFAVPTAWAPVYSGSFTVPQGYTTATFDGVVSIGAWNASATGDYLYVRCSINGSPGASLPVWAAPSAYGTVSASAIRLMTGLTAGQTISVAVEASAASGWGTNGSNIANIDVTCIFTR